MKPLECQDERIGNCSLEHLKPSKTALAACQSVGVKTIQDFIDTQVDAFLTVPNFGKRNYRALAKKVEKYIAAASTSTHGSKLETDHDRALNGLIQNPRALKAFVRLGIKTVGDFLSTPRERVLAVPGFGKRTYEEVSSRIHALLGDSNSHLLPDCLLDFKLYDLGLSDQLRATLNRLGLITISDVLRTPKNFLQGESGIGTTGLEELRRSMDQILRVGITQISGYGTVDLVTFSGFLGQMLGVLDQGQRKLLKQRVGLGCKAQSLLKLATTWKVSEEQIQAREDALRRSLSERLPAHLMELRRAINAELRAFEGIITGDRLAMGTILHACAKESRDNKAPLRFVAFLFPDEFHFGGEFLSGMPARLLTQLKNRLMRCTEDVHLPVSLETLESDVKDVVDPVPRELLLHLLRDHLQLSVQIDPRKGELITRKHSSITNRLQSIIDDSEAPLGLEDLFFRYRDHFGACRKSRLLDEMRKDRRFIKLEENQWGLREQHLDELELVRTEAERVSKKIIASGKRHGIFNAATDAPETDRAAHLLVDHLRREPTLRYLGQGEFVSRNIEHSDLVQGLVNVLRHATGEIPFSRFLQNQSDSRKRLTSAILNGNRLFISPVADRIDLLENYPFNQDRLCRLLQATDACLEENNGYCMLSEIGQAVEEAGLGGGWLTTHMLQDLLRRHGAYESLPGEVIAQASLGLMGWIQQRARDALRICNQPMTADEVLAEKPDLAEFRTSLVTLLEHDPLVQSEDGLHFTVM